ncbi:MAG: pyrimidine/purine nucleoside phosphorylase [Bacteroidota bacterium]|nr:pyrimidine/purine nucleoside phosphorylase [Bacteroidota bacterium]
MFKTNEYFDGNVMSIAYTTAEGDNATIGVMAKGEYEFGTATVEYMTVTSGKMNVLLPDTTEWKEYKEFETFIVDKDKKFKVKVDGDTSYRCLYK